MSMNVVDLTRTLVDIDSTTGREEAVGRWLSSHLRGLGYTVLEQAVDGSRFNILATLDPPDVVLTTHMDCVPPFFPSRVVDARVFGRGACDAKGIAAAQIMAAERMRAKDERRVGLLFVVGEERCSDGARAANAAAPGSRFFVDGEPTDLRLGRATRGMWRVRLHAAGRAAHSSSPELGESAIERLVDALVRLRGIELPSDPELGLTTYTVGLMTGGVAANVVPPSASAEVMFRTVSATEHVRQAIESLQSLVRIEDVREVPPVRLLTLPGFQSAIFRFTTDVPFLDRWGQALLYGPGSIRLAHTDEESIATSELDAAVDGYVGIVQALRSLASAP